MKKREKRKIAYIIVGGISLITLFLELMQNTHATYGLVEIIFLFGVLLGGYKYGQGTGAVLGTGAGILLTLWNQNMGALGMLAVMGVMAGSFRQLGKMATVIAYISAGIGVGVLYSPELLQILIIEFFMSSLMFLLMPEKFLAMELGTMKSSVIVTKQEPEVVDGVIGKRFLRMGDSFLALGNAFLEYKPVVAGVFDVSNEQQVEEWKHRYIESRQVMAKQYVELSQLMHTFQQEMKQTVDVTKQVESLIKKRLKETSICVEQMFMIEGENKRKEAILTLHTENGNCVTAKEIANIIGEILHCSFRPSMESRPVVTTNSSVIRLEEEPPYVMLYGVARASKEKGVVSGDNFSYTYLPKGKVMLGLCDGMGSGQQAYEESKSAIELTEQLLDSGFQPQTVVKIVHNALVLQKEELHPLALDLAVIDLYTGICEVIKSGATVTLIKKEEEIKCLEAEALPMGFLPEIEPKQMLYKLKDGDIIIMVTDGVIESFLGEDKEDSFKRFCSRLKGSNPKDIANKILLTAMSRQNGVIRDDMTVLVAGIWKK